MEALEVKDGEQGGGREQGGKEEGRPLGQREANGAPSPTAERTGRRVGRAGRRREGRCDHGGGGGGRHNRVPPTASTLVPRGSL